MARREYVARKTRPLVVICSEGKNSTAEKIYFSNFTDRNCRIKFCTGSSTDPVGMLEDFKKYIKNEELEFEEQCSKYLLIDTDLSPKQIKAIETISKECEKLGIEIIISSPTFEIWYLMHFRSNKLKFNASKEVKRALEEEIGGTYSETINMYPSISSRLESAIANAKRVNSNSLKDCQNKYLSNPYSEVYKVIEKINEYKNKTE